jgi:ABC-2 type transport system permease protein
MMSGVYWFVFTQVFHRSAGEAPYMVFLLSGLLPWTWFSSGVIDCAKVLRTEARLVRSLSLPREIWVCRVVAIKGIEFAFSLPVLFLFVLCYGAPMNWRIVLLLPAVLILGILLMGLGLLLSPLVVLVPDLQRLLRLTLRVLSYASPVIYAVSDVPRRVTFLFAANPMSGIVELCRSGFFPNQLDWGHVVTSVLLAFGILFAGGAVFRRMEQPVLKEL